MPGAMTFKESAACSNTRRRAATSGCRSTKTQTPGPTEFWPSAHCRCLPKESWAASAAASVPKRTFTTRLPRRPPSMRPGTNGLRWRPWRWSASRASKASVFSSLQDFQLHWGNVHDPTVGCPCVVSRTSNRRVNLSSSCCSAALCFPLSLLLADGLAELSVDALDIAS